ncbi:MAG TPA: radical SAM protein [Pyrinomonadaceae bacterium]|nr:radical SAM protein [Pyrinomonadaceae bacterium]
MAQLHFHSLVLETTDRCNAKCGMCYQSAAPHGSDVRGDFHLPLEVSLRVVEEASELKEVESRVHVSGGEAFLYYDETLSILSHAKTLLFRNIGSTTNGFWATNDVVAERRCLELLDAGLDYLEVSLDYWHAPYVSLDRIKTLLAAARHTGIKVILRTLSSRSHHIDDLLQSFSAADLLHVTVANGRVHPVGRAAEEVPGSEIYFGDTNGCCERMLNLTIAPNGNVYPCCAGADMTESMSSGNVRHISLKDALFNMKTDRTIREVIHAGSGALIPIIKELGYADRLRPQYSSICHLCWDIFKDKELAAALRKYFEDDYFEKLVDFMQSPPLAPALTEITPPAAELT